MTPATSPVRSNATHGEVDGWALTGRISPRRVVRVAGVDAEGQSLNSYPLVHPIAGAQPRTPWAVHLADATGRFRLLCVDLDAKGSSEAAAADATQFGELVSELGIEHLVCASGPTGGRHVWIGLRDALDAEAVRALAYLLKAWLPSLDVAPLTNPTSGCARPPGAPHRLGGNSQVIAGSVAVLTEPTVTTGQIHALMSRVADHVHAVEPATQPTRSRPVAVVDGMPFLPGTKRALSASCRGLLEATPTGDLSTVLWRVLCGAAAARWRFRDVLALADAPGLEHARTLRAGATRMPRPTRGPASPTAMLRRQWTRAVQAVAQLGPGQAIEGTDKSFDTRAEVVTELVRTVQRRADATAGRWGRSRACLAQRRVLDALCLFHLQGVRPDEVEADIRRLAMTCGLDRETARRSLLALTTDGWITRTQSAAGRRGARWSIDPGGAVHSRISELLSQADPRPAGTGSALRSALLNQLADRLNDNAHDAFATNGGLGPDAGTLYGRLREPMDAAECSYLLGWSIDKTTIMLDRLNSVGLVEWRERCWRRVDTAQIDQVAIALGTNGVGQRRADLYAVERTLWAWWCTEVEQLRTVRSRRGSQRVRQARSWPPHPRRHNGRADFAAARRTLRRRPETLVGLVSLRGTPEAAPISRPTFGAPSPRTTLNRTGPGLPGRVTPGSSERSRSKNFAPGCPPTALLLTSGR